MLVRCEVRVRCPHSDVVQAQQVFFQQVRSLSVCDAEDGRVVGHMLLELVQTKPKDPAHAIRTFVSRTAMLRECGFRHIGAMLAWVLTADDQSGRDDEARIVVLTPSAVTEQHATAIGSAIASSTRRSHAPAEALKQVVLSHAVLRAMKSGYVWFVPMLEVITAPTAVELRRSSWMKRLSSIVPAKALSVAPYDVCAADAEANNQCNQSNFSLVVCLGAHATPCTPMNALSLQLLQLIAPRRRRLLFANEHRTRNRRCRPMLAIVRPSPRPSRRRGSSQPTRYLHSAWMCMARPRLKAPRR